MESDNTHVLSARALTQGYMLHWYEILSVLGQGGFGITYLAEDKNLGCQVAIKEYLPASFAYRHSDFTVAPITENHADSFAWGLNSFLSEARTLAKFKHRNVVQVYSVFEAHGTAYMVMSFEEGETLSQIIKNGSFETGEEYLKSFLYAVIEGLQLIHDAGFIHRDIKPGNLFIREDGSPVLIDFGSARLTSNQDDGDLTTLVSEGYTPVEQYSANYGEQGPWTDIYALAALIYFGITGRRPASALDRSAKLLREGEDSYIKLSSLDHPKYSSEFVTGIDSGLNLDPQARPQSLQQWRELFETDLPISGAEAITPWNQNEASEMPFHEPHLDVEASSRVSAVNKASGFKLRLASAVVVVAAVVWLLGREPEVPKLELTEQDVNRLPVPLSDVRLRSPYSRIENRLVKLEKLAELNTRAQALQAHSDLDTSYLISEYRSISKLAMVRANENISLRIIAQLEQIPGADAELLKNKIQHSLVDMESLITMLKKEQRSEKEQQLILYKITSMSEADRAHQPYQEYREEMAEMLVRSIVDLLKKEKFDSAVRNLEIALLVEPEDRRFQLLKKHLQQRNL